MSADLLTHSLTTELKSLTSYYTVARRVPLYITLTLVSLPMWNFLFKWGLTDFISVDKEQENSR